jgi:hypothetical protein
MSTARAKLISWEGEFTNGSVPHLSPRAIPWNEPIIMYFSPSECPQQLLLENVVQIMFMEGFKTDDAIGLVRQALGSRSSETNVAIESIESASLGTDPLSFTENLPEKAVFDYRITINLSASNAEILGKISKFLSNERKSQLIPGFHRHRRKPESLAKEWIVYALHKDGWSVVRIDEFLEYIKLPKLAPGNVTDAKPALRLLVHRVRKQIDWYRKFCRRFRPGFKVRARLRNETMFRGQAM